MSKSKRYSLEFTPETISLINKDCGMVEMINCANSRALDLIKHIVILANKNLLDCDDINLEK